MEANQQNVQDIMSQIPERVIEEVTKLDLKASVEFNHEISQLLHQSVLLGGKRLRPLLTFLIGDFLGLESLEVLRPYARAIELVHGASLAHDDVVDRATTRRGRASINQMSSNKMAVLAGDYLLADVIVDVCQLGRLPLVQELSNVIKDLAEGEWLQIQASHENPLKWETVEKVAEKKTASVLTWCCVAPTFFIKGGGENITKYCREFGLNFGKAFQLIDDTIDFLKTSGKDQNLDLKNRVASAMVYELTQINPEPWTGNEDLIDEPAWSQDEVQLAIQRVRARAESYIKRAGELLHIIDKELNRNDANKTRQAKSAKSIEFLLTYLLYRNS